MTTAAKDEKTKKKRKQHQPEEDNTGVSSRDDKKMKKNRRRRQQEEMEEAALAGENEDKKERKKRQKLLQEQQKQNTEAEDDKAEGKQHQEVEKRTNSRRQKEGKKNRVIEDARFSGAHSDPRFQRVPQRQSKVTIDPRFSRMFSEKSFSSSAAPVDKRGKPREGKRENPLLRYYLQDKQPAEAAAVEQDGEEDPASSGSDGRSEAFEEEGSNSSGVDTDESLSTDEDDDEDDDDDQYSVNSDICRFLMANHEDTPMIEEETHRLAAVNMDWDYIKAVDLYVLMSSCLPKGGQISSVAIYPSEFGLKCMEIEAVHGPYALFDDRKKQNEDDDVDDEIVNEETRSYQLNRLRYYYAVVACDSSATANHLYKNLDGTELLRTSNVLDLRFIPDSMEFKHPPRDIATQAPANYKQPDFHTRALQHCSVKLSWEEDEPNRTKILRRKFKPNQLDELEFKEYLASDDGDSDDEESDKDNKGEKYQALLQQADASDTENDDDSGQEMEITFLPGAENLSKHVGNKKDKSEEGVWEASLRKRREKMKLRKKNAKFSSEDESSDSDYQEAPGQPDDFFVEEPSEAGVKKDGKKGGKNLKERKQSQGKDREEEKGASREELELLLTNDEGMDNHLKGYNIKPKKAKGKKGMKTPAEDKLPDVDAGGDPRFASRLTSNLFALDPTDPQYKRSAAGIRRELLLKQKKPAARKATEDGEMKPPEQVLLSSDGTQNDLQNDEMPLKREKHELMSLVRSLKLKSEGLRKTMGNKR